MRTRAWRRQMEERVVIKRLHILDNWHWGYTDVNGVSYEGASLKDYIGSAYNFKFKTYTTDKYDTRYKTKYSPNRRQKFQSEDPRRESDKVEFKKILESYGLKHFNSGSIGELDY